MITSFQISNQMFGFIFVSILILSYALPWAQVGEEKYAPGQLVIPYAKYALARFGFLKNDPTIATTISDIFVAEKNLRYHDAPPSEGGPHNQITFELIFYAMIVTLLLLIVPIRMMRIVGYLLSLASSSAFLLAMLFLENKTLADIFVGLYSNIVGSVVFLALTFVLN